MIIGILLFVIVYLLGTFLNTVIYRIPKGNFSLFTPLVCPVCESDFQSIGVFSALSYILFAKCPYCGQISAKYFLIKLLAGMTALSLFLKYGLTVDFLAFCFLMLILLAVFFIDLEHQIIPNELVIAGLSGGVILFIYNLFRPFHIYSDRLWWNPLLGLVSGSGFLLAVAVIGSFLYHNKEVMGMGDVKLLAPIGLFLGWRMTLLTLYISVIFGGIFSLGLIFFGKANRKSMIPFGPYIVIGVFVTVMWGWDMVHWYIRTFLW